MTEKLPERTWSAPPSYGSFDEPSTSCSGHSGTRSSTPASCDDAILYRYNEIDRVIQLAMSILVEKQAIPIRVKILLDKILSLLQEEEIVEVLRESNWSWLDYCRGYKLEDPPGVSVATWHMVDELKTMERFTSFQLCSPLLQNFRAGFLHPWAPLVAPIGRPAAAMCNTSYSKEQQLEAASSTSSSEERVNVTDSRSPSPAAIVAGYSSHQESSDSPTEDPADLLKMKKRVICEVCSKSFCDKGALKIHTSAVHLKEMHKCTVPGCEKEFSSRRSRNRHSSNTNPKLHIPEGGQQNCFREQMALTMSMNGLTSTAAGLVTSPLSTTIACPSASPASTSPCSPPLIGLRKRKAEDTKEEMLRNLDLSWRKTGLPLPPKMPYVIPHDQMLLALQLFHAQASAAALTGLLNSNSA